MKTKQLFILSLVMLSFLALPSKAALNTAAITCPGEVRIGNVLSCTATGLTVGSDYIVNAQHSSGNVSSVKTASTTTEYFRVTMTTADSDGIVSVDLALYDSTPPAGNSSIGVTIDSALVTLINPGADIPTSFFQNLLSAVLIIGIFAALMTAFFIYKKRK